MEKHAKSLLTRSPEAGAAYILLAGALAAIGADRAAVAEAIRQGGAHIPPDRRYVVTLEEARLAIAFGDFDGAERLLKDAEAGIDRSSERAAHASWAQQVFELNLETGRTAAALKVAEAFAHRQRAWSGAVASYYGTEDEGVLLVPRMLGLQARAGKMSPERRKSELDAWLSAAGIPGDERTGWIAEYVASTETPAEAERAVAAMPKEDASLGARLIPLRGLQSALTGRVLFLAGRTTEAIAELRRSAQRCELLDSPLAHTQSHLWLGQALEAANDRAAACAEYQIVLSRWKDARPPSLSARTAAARRTSLGCER
jgi:hypothetical protein